jgi:hypothetical protein
MYHDKAQAESAAREAFIERGAELWVYRCDYCSEWHLTHHGPREERLLRGMDRYAASRQGKPRSRKRGFKPRKR